MVRYSPGVVRFSVADLKEQWWERNTVADIVRQFIMVGQVVEFQIPATWNSAFAFVITAIKDFNMVHNSDIRYTTYS